MEQDILQLKRSQSKSGVRHTQPAVRLGLLTCAASVTGGFECKSHGHRREFIAGPDSFPSESRIEDSPDGGYEGRTPGEEDHVDVARANVARFEQGIYAGLDLHQFL